jgi:hypothetical protein
MLLAPLHCFLRVLDPVLDSGRGTTLQPGEQQLFVRNAA